MYPVVFFYGMNYFSKIGYNNYWYMEELNSISPYEIHQTFPCTILETCFLNLLHTLHSFCLKYSLSDLIKDELILMGLLMIPILLFSVSIALFFFKRIHYSISLGFFYLSIVLGLFLAQLLS